MPKHHLRIIEASSESQPRPTPAAPRWSVVLRALREARGLTQDGWAARLGYGRATIQRWERGEAVPNADAVEALVKLCREEGLLRTFARGPLQGVDLSAELLRELLAEARQAAAPRPGPEETVAALLTTVEAGSGFHLPPQLTSFLGREAELGELAALLSSSRLLTLVGPPGVGKTRLAVEGAREAGGSFPDGVCFVPLAPLSGPHLVLPAIAQHLGVAEGGRHPLGEVLATWLRRKSPLLVLDNFEHVLGAATDVLELVGACPGVRVVVTSRTPLRVRGEQLLPVAPLPVPEAPRAAPDAELATCAAVRLFVERARAVKPDFAPTLEERWVIAEICRQLDGLPLAIELAAARIRLFPPAALLQRLSSQRLRFLTAAPLDQPARQQTLRATIDWSHSLLAEDERAVLRRLAVFAGGCSLDAAGAICAGDDVAADDVPDVVVRLVDRSLVVPDRRDDEARIRLLETIREYAGERLVAAGEAEATRDRHRDWFAAFAEQAELALRGAEQFAWARRLEAERDNLRAALTRSVEAPAGGEAGLRLVGALAPWWQWQGNLVEGKTWLVRALAGRVEADSPVRARALGNGAWLAFRQGDYDLARALATELLARSRPKGDRYGTLAALRTLAVTAGEREGECDTAISLTRESLAVCRELGECWETAHQLFVVAVGRNRSCEYGVARAYLEESLAILRKLGDRHLATLALSQLGAAARGQGDDRAAEALLTEALAGLRTWRDHTSTGFCLAELAAIARHRGDFATARTRLAESLRLYWEAGDRPAATRLLHRLAGLAVAEGRLERGARLFGAAEAFRDALGVAWILPAERAEYEDDVGAARRLLDGALFERIWSEGRALPPEQAIADALDSG